MSRLRKIPHTIFFPLLFTYLSINVLQPCVLGAQTTDLPVRCIDVITTDHRGVELSLTSTIFYDTEEDEIYVTDGGKGQLVIYSSGYFPHLAVGSGRGLNSINSCYVNNGLLYVCLGISKSDPRGHIAVLNRALLLTKKIYLTGFEQATSFIPRKMAVGLNANLYVAGVNSTDVIVLDPDGKYLRSIIQHELVLGVTERAPVVSITVGQDGRLYFLSEDMSKIYVYDRNEEFLYKFGQKGGVRGKLSRPRGIAVDDQRKLVYVVDYMRHSVSAYSMKGNFLFDFGGKGYGRGWFLYPTDICVDGSGRLLVTDTFNRRVQVFEVLYNAAANEIGTP
jgi:DNA-binding beta-propeller fold protein YncE